MNNKQVKRLMTDVAKGKITMAEAEKQMNPAQDNKNNSEKEFIDDESTAQKKKQKTQTKSKIGGKKS